MAGMRACLDCGDLTRATRCVPCRRGRDRARGSRQQRGYDAEHDRTRLAYAPEVATGTVRCARCGQLIGQAERWDVGHPDHESSGGPEHADCNRGKRPRPTP